MSRLSSGLVVTLSKLKNFSHSRSMTTGRTKVDIPVWNEMWENTTTPFFHHSKVHKYIIKHHQRLFPDGNIGRIFIPLCGKTLDMVWLAEKGHDVVGIDCSDVGIKQFFEENQIKFKKCESGHEFDVYVANDQKISIYCGDFFKLTSKHVGRFDAMWDRGSFTAVDVNLRPNYVEIIKRLMNPHCRYLLSSADYDPQSYAGPPHYLTHEDVIKYFGSTCDIELLESKSVQSPVYGEAVDELRIITPKNTSKL